MTTGYKQDFENSASGWLTSGVKNSWERGIPQSGPNAAASGKNVFATNLTGPYESSANMNLLMPPVSVPKNQKLYLTYKYWHDIEEDFDYGFVYVQPEGKGEWIPAAEYSGKTSEWKDGQIDLSEYGGQTIKVMFNLQSDDSIEGDGLYIDDVALVKEVKSAGTKNDWALKNSRPK